MKTAETKVFIVEDHPVMRLGLKMMLEGKKIKVCGEAENLENAIRDIPGSSADIVVFDLSLNGENALPTIEQIHCQRPELGLIIYSMHDAPLLIENAMNLGASAYVTKAEPVETIFDAIQEVNAGRKFLSPLIAKSLEERIKENSGHSKILKSLSAREIEVLTGLGHGLGRSEIAQKHGLSVRTIETYISRLKKKLGVDQHRDLIREAIRVIHSG
ncbi:MAG: response regulator transcription factor [Candidatus Riflebacteria bacterium]